ncbi:MAG: galactose oxidase [Planctomycetota bacterium]|nr:MAG: galactose oxidase [Planctomycetota bacterium]
MLVCAFAVVAGASAQAQQQAPDWVEVTPKAPWQARDSQGEVVYRDRLWILGGWFDSFQHAPRDVWNSADGEHWQRVTAEAPWRHSDLAMSLVFDDRMWMLGGWYGGRMPEHEAGHEVWSSRDGRAWDQATSAAAWSARLAAAAVVFKDRMWILGGSEDYYFGDASSLKNDVWSSADGKHWRLECEHAPWAPRAYHQAVVLGDRIYVFGGGNYVPTYEAHHDVWSSSDGVHWEQLTDAAPWHARLWFPAVVYRDRMWILGGWSNDPSRNWNDVWYSRDGRDWRQLVSSKIWKARHEHSAFVWRDKIWIAGGHAQPLSSEVWSLEVPPDWFPGDEDVDLQAN